MIDHNPHINHFIEQFRNYGDLLLLDSQKVDHPASERSYLAAMPKKMIWGKGNQIYQKEGELITKYEGNSWISIRAFQEKEKDWVFGYFGYDLKNSIEELSSNNVDFTDLPDFYFMVPEVLISFAKNGDYHLIKGELPETELISNNQSNLDPPKAFNQISISKTEYISNVQEAQNLIYEGEIYEVNYSYLRTFDFEGSPWQLYQNMREVGPVPFGAFLKINDVEVCCASPERFLKRINNKVYSQPIKGTISNTEESQLSELNSEKNRAENLMIVDLVRNDLNRVAKSGTVSVKNLFEVQSFETVHQLVSTVECMVEEETNSLDIIESCFPMGSMTGAPKIAAMKAIERLENYKRGIYSGAIGYFKPDGDFDFNVVIRTAIIENGKLIYPVGGAITSDSIAEEEWEETRTKTQALKKALK